MDEALGTLLSRADRVRQQSASGGQDANKLYSLHEPQVRCISKGKAHKRYESCPEPRRIGQKVAVATTNGGNWISGNTLECCRDLDHLLTTAKLLPDNPYDGHTLAETMP